MAAATGARSTSCPACRPTPTSRASARRSTMRRRSTSRPRTTRTATSRRTCSRAPTAAARGSRSPAISRRAARPTRSPKITSIPNLLFAGTEFAAYFSKDGGQHWIKIAGVPTIAVREIAIQKRENDLRARHLRPRHLHRRRLLARRASSTPATLTDGRDAVSRSGTRVLYVPTLQYGLPGKGFQGEMLYAADEPAVWRHLHLSAQGWDQDAEAEAASTRRRRPRRRASRSATRPADELRAEADEEAPAMLLTISGTTGTPVRVITGPIEKGSSAWRGICGRRRISCRRTVRAASSRSSSAIRSSVRMSCPATTA